MDLQPFLPFTSRGVAILGHEGELAGPLRFAEAAEEDGSTHRVLTGDYEQGHRLVGTERAAGGPEAARAAAALPQAAARDGRRGARPAGTVTGRRL